MFKQPTVSAMRNINFPSGGLECTTDKELSVLSWDDFRNEDVSTGHQEGDERF